MTTIERECCREKELFISVWRMLLDYCSVQNLNRKLQHERKNERKTNQKIERNPKRSERTNERAIITPLNEFCILYCCCLCFHSLPIDFSSLVCINGRKHIHTICHSVQSVCCVCLCAVYVHIFLAKSYSTQNTQSIQEQLHNSISGRGGYADVENFKK